MRQTGFDPVDWAPVSAEMCAPPVSELSAATNVSFLGGAPLDADFFTCTCNALQDCARAYYGYQGVQTEVSSVFVTVTMLLTFIAFVVMLLRRTNDALADRNFCSGAQGVGGAASLARICAGLAALRARAEAQKQAIASQPYTAVPGACAKSPTREDGRTPRLIALAARVRAPFETSADVHLFRLFERAVACWTHTLPILTSRVAASIACGLAVDVAVFVAFADRILPIFWTDYFRSVATEWPGFPFPNAGTAIAVLATVYTTVHPIAYVVATFFNIRRHMRLRAALLAVPPTVLYGTEPAPPDVQQLREIAAHGRTHLLQSGRYMGYAALSMLTGAQVLGLYAGLVGGTVYLFIAEQELRQFVWPAAKQVIQVAALFFGTRLVLPLLRRCLVRRGERADGSPDGILVVRPCLFSWYEVFYAIISVPTGLLVAGLRCLIGALAGVLGMLDVTGRAYIDRAVFMSYEPVWRSYTALLVLEHHALYAAARSRADQPECSAVGADAEAAAAAADHAPLQPWAEWAWGEPTPSHEPPPTSLFQSLVLTCLCVTLFLGARARFELAPHAACVPAAACLRALRRCTSSRRRPHLPGPGNPCRYRGRRPVARPQPRAARGADRHHLFAGLHFAQGPHRTLRAPRRRPLLRSARLRPARRAQRRARNRRQIHGDGQRRAHGTLRGSVNAWEDTH